MSLLRSYQESLSQHLYNPKNKTGNVLNSFLTTTHVTPEIGLAIYEKHTIFALLGIMESHYPATQIVLTKNNFNFLIKEYIHSHPSMSHNIELYGHSFADFLDQREEIHEMKWIVDLTRYESIVAAGTHPIEPTDSQPNIRDISDLTSKTATQVFATSFCMYTFQIDAPVLCETLLNGTEVDIESEIFQLKSNHYVFLYNMKTLAMQKLEPEYFKAILGYYRRHLNNDVEFSEQDFQKHPGLFNKLIAESWLVPKLEIKVNKEVFDGR